MLFKARAQVWLAPNGGIVGSCDQGLEISRYLGPLLWLKKMSQDACLQNDWAFMARSGRAGHWAVALRGIRRSLAVGMLDPGLGSGHGVSMVMVQMLCYPGGVLNPSPTEATLLLQGIPQSRVREPVRGLATGAQLLDPRPLLGDVITSSPISIKSLAGQGFHVHAEAIEVVEGIPAMGTHMCHWLSRGLVGRWLSLLRCQPVHEGRTVRASLAKVEGALSVHPPLHCPACGDAQDKQQWPVD